MAIGVDSSKWKPRKLLGTPAFKNSNQFAACVIGFGVLCGIFLQYGSFTSKARQGFEKSYVDPVEEVERKLMIASGLPNRSADQVRKLIEEESRVDLPNK